jgi:phosphatidylglycerol:prolipoprotein diacylglycerol transferase
MPLVAVAVCFLVARHRVDVVAANHIDNLCFLSCISALITARVAYRLSFLREDESLWSIWLVWKGGGFLSHAGLLAGGIAAVGYMLAMRLPALKIMDAMIPALTLGQAVWRLGCYMSGCCWGKICSTSAANTGEDVAISFGEHAMNWVKCILSLVTVQYEANSPTYVFQLRTGLLKDGAQAAIPVYPVQLYEMILCLLLWMLTCRRMKLNAPGQVFCAFGASYAVGRYWLGFFRADCVPCAFGVSRSQVVWFLVGVITIVWFFVCGWRFSRCHGQLLTLDKSLG